MTRFAALVVAISFVASGLTEPITIDTSARSTPGTAPTDTSGAVPISLVIRNDGDADDRLLGGHTPAAARVEMHRTRLIHGRRVMATAPDGIAVPAGATLILEPGGNHLMVSGLQIDFVQGAALPLTLVFERAGEVTVMVRVRRRVDAAGITPFPPVIAGDISVSLASAPPAAAATPIASPIP